MNAIGKPSHVEGNVIAKLVTDTTSKKINIEAAQVYKGFVPDVNGLGLKDAVYLLEKEGLHVQVEGKGKVQVQSVPAGTKALKGQTIILQLS
jgi:cell division protein FtsI (penicillin-binding protein 3)